MMSPRTICRINDVTARRESLPLTFINLSGNGCVCVKKKSGAVFQPNTVWPWCLGMSDGGRGPSCEEEEEDGRGAPSLCHHPPLQCPTPPRCLRRGPQPGFVCTRTSDSHCVSLFMCRACLRVLYIWAQTQNQHRKIPPFLPSRWDDITRPEQTVGTGGQLNKVWMQE